MLEDILASRRKLYAQGRERAFRVASTTCAVLGRKQEALAFLREGWAKRDSYMLFTALESTFENLHGEPEFQRLLKEIGLP